MINRLIIVSLLLGLVFGSIFGWKAYQQRQIAERLAARGPSTVTVATAIATTEFWAHEEEEDMNKKMDAELSLLYQKREIDKSNNDLGDAMEQDEGEAIDFGLRPESPIGGCRRRAESSSFVAVGSYTRARLGSDRESRPTR